MLTSAGVECTENKKNNFEYTHENILPTHKNKLFQVFHFSISF